MKDENTVIFTGRIVRDPEGSKTSEGKAVVKMSIALHATADNTYFLNIEGYDKLAEFALDNFKKGDPIMIRGYIRQRQWIDETSKRKNNYIDIVAYRIQLLGTYRDKQEEKTA